ncbi:hypothetical protein Q5H93_08355 [Hymenobacter sp. ASUV-10]|uniref:MmcQ/YjbR family DNA-binding protein n=1 Tax=Hymenobacter aranciens TaxID=3063996 RepID=A0ABT9B906_9BACT|nr:hypothetical protein [Hymenobacter sp. ASUV-10]MDO7874741.1 hypothetical protein [Hymenobacter sp. ASUV-10]
MAFPIPPAHLPGAKPEYPVSRRAMVRRLHNRRITMIALPNGDCYTHFAVALKPGEAAELRAEGHVDTVIDYILRDRVRYWVLILKGETFDAMIGCWGDLQARERQRKARKLT